MHGGRGNKNKYRLGDKDKTNLPKVLIDTTCVMNLSQIEMD